MNDTKLYLLDGFVDTDTLSPNKMYYYKLTKPHEKAMGVFTADIAYFTSDDKLLYVTPKETPGSYLPPFTTFVNVMWLCEGKIALHIEYSRNLSQICLLFVEKSRIVKIERINGDDLFGLFDQITVMSFTEIEDYITTSGVEIMDINQKEMQSRYKRGVFTKWYPR